MHLVLYQEFFRYMLTSPTNSNQCFCHRVVSLTPHHMPFAELWACIHSTVFVEFLCVPHSSVLGYKDNPAAMEPASWSLPSNNWYTLPFVERLLCARHETNTLLFFFPYNIHHSLKEVGFSYSHFVHEMIGNLIRVPQLVRSRVRWWTQFCSHASS